MERVRPRTPHGAFLMLSAALCVLPVASSAHTEIRSVEFAYFTLRNRSGSAEPGEVGHAVRICPPAVDYSREFQARAAEEMGLLPEKSAVAEMLSDYAVMREQARVCRSGASEIPPGGGGTAM